MIDREIESDQLPYCRRQGMAVLAYSPLARGLLDRQDRPDRRFADGDQRIATPASASRTAAASPKCSTNSDPSPTTHGITLAQLAIAWTLHQPGPDRTPCAAPATAEQAIENAAAADVKLDSEGLRLIGEALAEYQAASS